MKRYEWRQPTSRMMILWGLLFGSGVAQCSAVHATSFAFNEHCCFWMVSLNSGQVVSLSRRLEAGTPYRLFVMTDSYATQLEVSLTDLTGVIIARCGEPLREALVRFTPPATGTYTLRITAKQAAPSVLCSVLLLSEQGDWQVAQFHWSDALKQVQRLFTLLAEQAIEVALPSQGVCMVGGFVPAGCAVDFGRLTVDSEFCLWAAVGDSRVRSLQMTLRHDEAGTVANSGRDKPLALCASHRAGNYTPRVTVQVAAHEAFVVVVVLKACGFGHGGLPSQAERTDTRSLRLRGTDSVAKPLTPRAEGEQHRQ